MGNIYINHSGESQNSRNSWNRQYTSRQAGTQEVNKQIGTQEVNKQSSVNAASKYASCTTEFNGVQQESKATKPYHVYRPKDEQDGITSKIEEQFNPDKKGQDQSDKREQNQPDKELAEISNSRITVNMRNLGDLVGTKLQDKPTGFELKDYAILGASEIEESRDTAKLVDSHSQCNSQRNSSKNTESRDIMHLEAFMNTEPERLIEYFMDAMKDTTLKRKLLEDISGILPSEGPEFAERVNALSKHFVGLSQKPSWNIFAQDLCQVSWNEVLRFKDSWGHAITKAFAQSEIFNVLRKYHIQVFSMDTSNMLKTYCKALEKHLDWPSSFQGVFLLSLYCEDMHNIKLPNNFTQITVDVPGYTYIYQGNDLPILVNLRPVKDITSMGYEQLVLEI